MLFRTINICILVSICIGERGTECKFAIYIYMEVHMSPLSVARTPHYINEAELGYSHFLGWRYMESWRS